MWTWPVQGAGDVQSLGAGQVVQMPWHRLRGPDREPVRAHGRLNVGAEVAVFPGVPRVDGVALARTRRLGKAVAVEEFPIEDHVGPAVLGGPLQGVAQGRGLCGEDRDGLTQVAVRGGPGDTEPGAEGWSCPRPYGTRPRPATPGRSRSMHVFHGVCHGCGVPRAGGRRRAPRVPWGRRAWHDKQAPGPDLVRCPDIAMASSLHAALQASFEHSESAAIDHRWRQYLQSPPARAQYIADLHVVLTTAAREPRLRALFPSTSHQDLGMRRAVTHGHSRALSWVRPRGTGRYLVAGPDRRQLYSPGPTRTTLWGEEPVPGAQGQHPAPMAPRAEPAIKWE